MTISTTSSSITYTGNSATTVFTFGFVADQASDLVVSTTTAGVTTVLNPSVYTVVVNPPPLGGLWGIGGSVTYPISGTPLTSATTITIQRAVPYTQSISISNQGAFYPQAVEQGLDILELQIQQIQAAIAASTVINITVQNVSFYYNVITYGADPTGAADSTTAINTASTAAAATGGIVWFPQGTYKILGTLTLHSNVIYQGVGPGGSIISGQTANIDYLLGTGINACTVRDLKLVSTVANNGSATVAGIRFSGSTNCKVLNCEFSALAQGGVSFDAGSQYCEARGNYFHSWNLTNNVQDSADIVVYHDSSDNIVDGNFCYGGGFHGVLVQDNSAGGHPPLRNIVTNNRIGAHSAYGVVSYSTTAEDMFTTISDNDISGITGTQFAGVSGAGVYISDCGGNLVSGNNIRSCCLSTSSASLVPSGIGLNMTGTTTSMSPNLVVGNNIKDISTYYGVYLINGVTPTTISGNVISLRNNTSSSTSGVYVSQSSNVSITGNSIVIATSNSTTGIFVYANGANCNNISIVGNTILGGDGDGIRTDSTSTFVNTNIAISGNTVSGGSANYNPYHLTAITGGALTGNVGIATTTQAIVLINDLQLRIANNVFTSTGSQAVSTGDTCTGSYFDKTNYFGTSLSSMSNAATGLIVEQLSSSAPGSSTWAVGDRIEQAVPVVGNPKGWRCTVAGSPGTWVSEGNL